MPFLQVEATPELKKSMADVLYSKDSSDEYLIDDLIISHATVDDELQDGYRPLVLHVIPVVIFNEVSFIADYGNFNHVTFKIEQSDFRCASAPDGETGTMSIVVTLASMIDRVCKEVLLGNDLTEGSYAHPVISNGDFVYMAKFAVSEEKDIKSIFEQFSEVKDFYPHHGTIDSISTFHAKE